MEIRQRADAGTRPAPETSAAGAAKMRVVGAAAIALGASLVIENAVVLAGSVMARPSVQCRRKAVSVNARHQPTRAPISATRPTCTELKG